MIPSCKDKVARCHNCGRYFKSSESVDGGTTCSSECSNEYVDGLNNLIKQRELDQEIEYRSRWKPLDWR